MCLWSRAQGEVFYRHAQRTVVWSTTVHAHGYGGGVTAQAIAGVCVCVCACVLLGMNVHECQQFSSHCGGPLQYTHTVTADESQHKQQRIASVDVNDRLVQLSARIDTLASQV